MSQQYNNKHDLNLQYNPHTSWTSGPTFRDTVVEQALLVGTKTAAQEKSHVNLQGDQGAQGPTGAGSTMPTSIKTTSKANKAILNKKLQLMEATQKVDNTALMAIMKWQVNIKQPNAIAFRDWLMHVIEVKYTLVNQPQHS